MELAHELGLLYVLYYPQAFHSFQFVLITFDLDLMVTGRVHDRVLKLNVMSYSSDASQTSEGVSIFAQCVIRESFNAFH